MNNQRLLGIWRLALILCLLIALPSCRNTNVAKRSEPPKPATAPAPALSPLQAAMLQAAAAGDDATVKEMLGKGVDVNMRGPNRNTPIMEAAYAGYLNTVKLLLDHGADLSLKKNDGATPGTLAHDQAILQLFNNVAALVEAAGKGDNAAINTLIEKGTPLNGLDLYGHSALTEAAWNGKTDTVKLLLEKGADPTIRKADGESPLGLAAGQRHTDITGLLKEAIAKRSKAIATPSIK